MKKHLLTLDATVTQFKMNSPTGFVDFYVEITDTNKLLQTTLTLSQFVPCDKDGNPMKKHQCAHTLCEDEYRKQLRGCKCEAYEAAEKAVRFKGWELVNTGDNFYIRHEDWILDWNGGFIVINRNLGPMVTLPSKATWKHLAEATESNPIELK